jgi:hypothetical protein
VVKSPSASYTAVIEWLPIVSADVVKLATPEPSSIPAPSGVEPSMNITVPVGIPEPGALEVTVAVNVTDCPNTEGLAEEATSELVAS